MSFYTCELCGGIPGITFCCSSPQFKKNPNEEFIDQVMQSFKEAVKADDEACCQELIQQLKEKFA